MNMITKKQLVSRIKSLEEYFGIRYSKGDTSEYNDDEHVGNSWSFQNRIEDRLKEVEKLLKIK